MTLIVNVRHRQGNFSLDADFSSGHGVTAIFGRSGSGKTSIIRIIAGLTRPDHGRVELDGEVLADTTRGIFTPGYRRGFGYIFQESRLFPHMTVRQNLDYGRRFARSRAARQPVDSGLVVDMLGIGALLDRHPEKLSGGEKQRVAIGRALLCSPRLLLMDEPLAALDDARKAEILPYIERLRDDTKIPVVYVSHSVSEVARLADKVIVMKDGRIETSGPANDVLGQAAFSDNLDRKNTGSIVSGHVDNSAAIPGLVTVRLVRNILLVPGGEMPSGKAVRVHIPARDVMLATARPEGISALNIFEGQILSIDGDDHDMVQIAVDCGGDTITSRITIHSRERLGLEPGKTVFAIVKTAALEP